MSCTSQDIADLKPEQLVQYLKSTTYNCLYNFIWTLDDNMLTVLTNAHVNAVMKEIAVLSPVYQGTNQQHLYELMDFAHAAYYLKCYNNSDPALFDPKAVLAATEQALDAFANSPYFNDKNDEAAKILYDWVCTVDGANVGNKYYPQIRGILHTFNTDQDRWNQHYQRTLVYTTLMTIYRQIGINPAFTAVIDQSLLDELVFLAKNITLPKEAQYLASNAIWVLGRFCKEVPAWKMAAVQAITDARAVWPSFSPQWLWTVLTLDECNDCLDKNGNKLCKADVSLQVEAKYLPNTYIFDDGAMVVRTLLTLDQIQPLYHAVKEVEAQFNRLTQTIAPLSDDTNGVLKIVLFGSRADYQNFASFLYGIDTANGGIYIEQRGTFYTYDRTPQESIYPMEELFRHEFSHYLVGRFLVSGMWGEEPIYANNRMVWFDEGLAEFCTWSSMDTGIRPRKRLVELIQKDGPNRMTVSQVLSAVYGDFKFYRYAAFLFSYWYQHDPATLLQLIDIVRVGDVAGFDAKITQLKANIALQKAYSEYLDSLVANITLLDDPYTNCPPLDTLDVATIAEVQTLFQQTRIGYLAECSVAASETNTRFSARGTLSGMVGVQQDIVSAWRMFDANLNELIGELKIKGINNFTALNGRFGRIRWVDAENGQSYPMADYFVDGPLVHGSAALQLPLQQVTADFHTTRFGVNATTTLPNPTTVQVNIPLTTRLHPDNMSDAILLSELEDAKMELRNQVYAIRPSYYRNFTVNWDGDAKVIPYSNQQKYGLRNIICLVQLA